MWKDWIAVFKISSSQSQWRFRFSINAYLDDLLSCWTFHNHYTLYDYTLPWVRMLHEKIALLCTRSRSLCVLTQSECLFNLCRTADPSVTRLSLIIHHQFIISQCVFEQIGLLYSGSRSQQWFTASLNVCPSYIFCSTYLFATKYNNW